MKPKTETAAAAARPPGIPQPWTPGPWGAAEGSADRREMSRVYRARDREGPTDFPVALVTCEWRNAGQRAEDLANLRLITAAPALALAWSLVPEETRGRILDALHTPETEWVGVAIDQLTAGR